MDPILVENPSEMTLSAIIFITTSILSSFRRNGKKSDARVVPVASNELLKLKHELYHEEKSAEEVASRLTQWYEQHLSKTKFGREQDRIAHVLSEQIGRAYKNWEFST